LVRYPTQGAKIATRGIEKDGNESGIEPTVAALRVTLRMPTSQQGTAAFDPPGWRSPREESWGVRRDPAGEWPRCGVFLYLAGGTSSPRSELLWRGRVSSFGLRFASAKPRLRPESGAFLLAAVSAAAHRPRRPSRLHRAQKRPSQKRLDDPPKRRLRRTATPRRAKRGRATWRPFPLPIRRGSDKAAP